MKQNKILSFLFAFFVTVAFTSCLKEANNIIDTGNGNTTNLLEFKNSGDNLAAQASRYPRYNKDLGSLKSGASATLPIIVSYSGLSPAPSDMTVNLAIDEAALALFNQQNGSNYALPPSTVFSFPSSVVIPQGQRSVSAELKITLADNYDFNKLYAVPIKIASSSPEAIISGNFGTALYSFSVRNKYDGIYTITALAPMVDATSATLTGLYPMEDMSLITNGTAVGLYDGQYFSNGYYHPIRSGASVSAYGNFSPLFFFDATGKITSVSNTYGQGAGNRAGEILADGPNKTVFKSDGTVDYFEVWYVMRQSGNVRTTFKERFTRTGDRP